MNIKLLSRAEIESLIKNPSTIDRYDELCLCTIIEPIRIADLVLKGRTALDWSEFRRGWDSLLNSTRLIVQSLDLECLKDSLFERTGRPEAIDLWPAAVASGIPPDQSICRLILRPLSHAFWDESHYDEMETWY